MSSLFFPKRTSVTILFITLAGLMFSACNETNSKAQDTPTNTTVSTSDSKAEVIYLKEWKGNIDSMAYLLESGENEFTPLMDFPDKEFLKEYPLFVEYEYFDMGNTEYPGIIGMVFSGGAHCCFNYTVYFPIGDNKYQAVYTFESGEGAVFIKDGMIFVDFYEQLGYFYTCYACSLDSIRDKEGWQIPSYFRLSLKDGRLEMAAADELLNKEIIEDLEFLKTLPIQKIVEEDMGMDNGLRKAFALEMIAYMLNNQLSPESMRTFFMKYYTGDDREKIFADLMEYAEGIITQQNMTQSILKNMEKYREMYSQ